VDITT